MNSQYGCEASSSARHPTLVLYDAVDRALGDYEAAQREFLKVTGWNYSSAHPDSAYRWSKAFGLKTYVFDSQQSAIDFELRLA